MTQNNEAPVSRRDAHSSGFLRELALIVRHRKMFAINVFVVTLAAVLFSLLTPEIYEAHTSLLPAEDDSAPFGGLTQLLRELPFQGANFPGVTTSSDMLGAFLHSRRLQEPIIEEFGLIDVFKADHLDAALIAFEDRLSASVSDEGMLHVRFRDRDAELAAKVLNRLIEELNEYNLNARISRSRLTRAFVEGRLTEAVQTLEGAEDALRAYQEEHSITISPEDEAMANAGAALIARKFALQVELEAISRFMDTSSPPYEARLLELQALEQEIGDLPLIGMEALRLYRDVKVQEEIYLLLIAELERARIEEHRDLPVFQVLDAAVAPEIRAWPKRKLIVLSAFVLSVMVSLLLAHVLEFIRRERETLRNLGTPVDF